MDTVASFTSQLGSQLATPTLLIAIALVFVVAGLVKGVVGLGLPTVAIALLGTLMEPHSAAALMIVPSLLTNAYQGLVGPATVPLGRRMASLLVGIIAGVALAAPLGRAIGATVSGVTLGVILVVYAALGLRTVVLHTSPARERWLAPSVGIVNGVITALTGVFVVPLVPYLQSLDLDRERSVQAMGLGFTVSTLALAASLGSRGAFNLPIAAASLLTMAPALVGMAVGQRIRQRISASAFKRWMAIALGVLGCELIVKGLIA